MSHDKSIVIHIGLPKTGSTALQDVYLSNIPSDNVCFLGKSAENGICHPTLNLIRDYLSSSGEEKHKKLFLEKIKKIPERTLIISDEMFVVDTEKSSWQHKVERLADLMKSENINLEKIVVVYRDPLDAVYSMYVENYNIVSSEYRDVTQYALKSNQALIYKYSYLHSVISSFFEWEKIRYVDYDAIKLDGGIAKVLPLMGLPEMDMEKKDRVNEKQKSGDEYISNPANIKDILLRVGVVRYVIGKIPRRYYYHLAAFFSRFKIRSGVSVKRPSSNDEEVIRDFLNEGADSFYRMIKEEGPI